MTIGRVTRNAGGDRIHRVGIAAVRTSRAAVVGFGGLMQIQVDLSTIPPEIKLRDAEDFTRFSVTAASVPETHVTRDALESLAGQLASDPDWRRQLQGMLDYAQGRGWIRDDGAIQAHVEWDA